MLHLPNKALYRARKKGRAGQIRQVRAAILRKGPG